MTLPSFLLLREWKASETKDFPEVLQVSDRLIESRTSNLPLYHTHLKPTILIFYRSRKMASLPKSISSFCQLAWNCNIRKFKRFVVFKYALINPKCMWRIIMEWYSFMSNCFLSVLGWQDNKKKGGGTMHYIWYVKIDKEILSFTENPGIK